MGGERGEKTQDNQWRLQMGVEDLDIFAVWWYLDWFYTVNSLCPLIPREWVLQNPLTFRNGSNHTEQCGMTKGGSLRAAGLKPLCTSTVVTLLVLNSHLLLQIIFSLSSLNLLELSETHSGHFPPFSIVPNTFWFSILKHSFQQHS